jgi:T4-like virus tail tube protein gp19
MRKTRRWEREPEREPGQFAKPPLARLDTAPRAGVLEDLQRAGGNNAVQRALAGAQLQRDSTTLARRMPYATARWALSIDGTTVPVRSVDGGSARAEVIEQPPNPSGVSLKHAAGVRFDPVSLEVGLDTGGLSDWLRSTLDRKYSRKDLVLHQVDTSENERGSIELRNALVTDIEVPKLDVGDTGEAWLKVKVQPELVLRSTGSGKTAAAKGKPDPLKPSTARLDVSGIGAVPELLSVAAFAFKQRVEEEPVGSSRTQRFTPTRLELDDLVVTLADMGKKSGTKGFDEWFEESVMKGNADHERTAVLTVKSHGGRTLTFTFSGVGISGVQMFEGSSGGGRQYRLYVEKATLKIG